MIHVTANAYYFRSLSSIGGVESHFFYLAQKYRDLDITFFYKFADPSQVRRLRKFAGCVKLNDGDKVICENLFCCYNRDILDQCEAKTTYFVLHGDYKDMVERGQFAMSGLPIDKRIDHYLGVSHHVCKTWKELTGIEALFIGEPVVLPEKRLRFLSATRLTFEKGWERMKILANELDKAKVNYEWDIFTNTPKEKTSPHIHFHDPSLDIVSMMRHYDAYIQLSDSEGFCLSAVEALLQGVPCILTNCPVFKEIGATEANCIVLNHNMVNIPIDRIRKIDKLKFTYEQPSDKWGEFFSKDLSKKKTECTVTATAAWQIYNVVDKDTGKIRVQGETWEVTQERLKEIQEAQERLKVDLIE